MQKKPVRARPKNLNLLTIRLPINAMVSIAHRMSGVVLFLLLPLLLWAFSMSIKSEISFLKLLSILQNAGMKVFFCLVAIPFFHHFYAGLRHLGQDVHWMTGLQKARLSGRLVFVLDAISVLAFGFWLW